MKLYGIPNCSTVKKARNWLDEHDIAYEFHDFKKNGVPDNNLRCWLQAVGWETLVNRRGTTWRSLDEDERAAVVDAVSAERALRHYPSLIKRPVLELGTDVLVGFEASAYEEKLA